MKVMQYIIGKWEYMILNQKEKNEFSLNFVILTSTTRACVQSVTKVFNLNNIFNEVTYIYIYIISYE